MQRKENNINLNESSDEKSNNGSKNSSNEDSIDNFDIDYERLTLIDVGERLKKKRAKKNNNSLLLEKKRKNPNTIISFDASSKTVLNNFCPSVEELNDFLDNCKIEEIDLTECNKKLPDSVEIFDNKEYMKKYHINKTYLSFEDSQYIKETKDNEENTLELINPIMASNPLPLSVDNKLSNILNGETKVDYINENIKNLQKILHCNTLDLGQKKWLNNHIKEIIDMPLDSVIIKGKKLEIIFDLDNTLVFTFIKSNSKESLDIMAEIEKNNPKKKIFSFSLRNNNKLMYSCLVFREEIYDFVNYIKEFCNFHVRTLANKNYTEKIIEKLEENLGIKFNGIIARDDSTPNKLNKSIGEFRNKNINNSNTIIFDDSINVWNENDLGNVIQSKYFFDKEFGVTEIQNLKTNSETENLFTTLSNTHNKLFYNSFTPGEICWRKQNIIRAVKCPFYQYKEQGEKFYFDFYNTEYLGDKKCQFIYMKDVVKIIYYMIFHDKVPLSEAIKLIRLNIFYEKHFYLKYVSSEGKNILSNIIQICGGEIVEPDDSISYKMSNIYLVCSMNIYEKERNTILNEVQNNKKFIIVNEKFILNCYYFMTDLELDCHDEEYDPEYCYNYCNLFFK